MLPIQIEEFLKETISAGKKLTSFRASAVGGGSINQAFRVTVNNREHYFLKVNSVSPFPGLFNKEKRGLEILAASKTIRTPRILQESIVGEQQLLLMEWIDPGERTEAFWRSFGEGLAALHHCRHDQFGLDHDNYMGSIPQSNQFTETWIDFFIERRLRPLMEQTAAVGLLPHVTQNRFEQLFPRLEQFFEKASSPSLLHGDLWSGNFLCDESNQPVLIDPAVYYGHSSMDLGMTTLFGGFDRAFYDAYQYHHPPFPGYREQWELSQLYPLLIHLRLFGSGYLAAIRNCLEKYT